MEEKSLSPDVRLGSLSYLDLLLVLHLYLLLLLQLGSLTRKLRDFFSLYLLEKGLRHFRLMMITLFV